MPRVFISYCSHDRKFVQTDLIPLLQANGLDTWSYDTDIATAEEWERKIKAGLESCEWFLVVMSPTAATSAWVRTEIHWALEHRQGCLVPLMLTTCNPADLHLQLCLLQYVDFRENIDRARIKLLSALHTSGATPLTPAVSSPSTRQPHIESEDTPQLLVDKASAPFFAPDDLYFSSRENLLVLLSNTFCPHILAIWRPTTVSFIEDTYYESLARSSIVPQARLAHKHDDVFYVAGWNERAVTLRRTMAHVTAEEFIALSSGGGMLLYDSRHEVIHVSMTPQHQVVAEAETPKVIRCLALSPDLKHMAAGMDGQSIVYDCATGRERIAIDESAPDRTFQRSYMRFSPDGTLYAYITPKRDIHYPGRTSLVLHRVSDWSEFRRFHADKAEIHCLAFSRDSKYVAAGNDKPEVVVFDIKGGEAARRLISPFAKSGGAYVSVAIAPDNGLVVAGRESWADSRRIAALELWDLRSGQYLFLMDWREGTYVGRLPSGRLHVSKGADNYVGVSWQLQKYELQAFLRRFPGECDQQLVSQAEMLAILEGRNRGVETGT